MQCQDVFLKLLELFFHPFIILKLRIYVWVWQYLSVCDEMGLLEVTMIGICFHCETHI
jgi:hypothetical protein